MPPKKKSNTGLIVGLIIGGVFLCCIGPAALLVGGGFWIFNKGKGIMQCTYAFRDVRDGLRLYAADHAGKLPEADKWQDEVAPYYDKVLAQTNDKDKQFIGIMPSGGMWGCDDGSGGRTGMALNDEIAGKELSSLESSSTVVLFEIERATRNAHEKYSSKPETAAPKILGSPRGWFLIRMGGEPKLMAKGREQSANTGPSGD